MSQTNTLWVCQYTVRQDSTDSVQKVALPTLDLYRVGCKQQSPLQHCYICCSCSATAVYQTGTAWAKDSPTPALIYTRLDASSRAETSLQCSRRCMGTRLSEPTFDLYKVGCNQQSYNSTAALAVHGHAEGHALAHDHGPMHQHYQHSYNGV